MMPFMYVKLVNAKTELVSTEAEKGRERRKEVGVVVTEQQKGNRCAWWISPHSHSGVKNTTLQI